MILLSMGNLEAYSVSNFKLGINTFIQEIVFQKLDFFC